MARRSRNRLLVPQADDGMSMLKADIMQRKGYAVDPNKPETVKYAVAQKLGVPLEPGYNGGITAENAGKVGGVIGGNMVRELIRRAQLHLAAQSNGGGEPRAGTRPSR